MLCGRRLVVLVAAIAALAAPSAGADTSPPTWSITTEAYEQASPGATAVLDFTLEAGDFTGEVTIGTELLPAELTVGPIAPVEVTAGNSYTVPVPVTVAPGTVASQYLVFVTATDSTGYSPSMVGVIQVLPADGGGSVQIIGAAAVTAGRTATVRMLYKPVTWLDEGTLTIQVPEGWSPPTAASVFADATVTISGNTITLSGVNLIVGDMFFFEYTGIAAGPTGPQTWAMSEANTAAGVLTPLAASPVIDVS